jgi:hypothetical protein
MRLKLYNRKNRIIYFWACLCLIFIWWMIPTYPIHLSLGDIRPSWWRFWLWGVSRACCIPRPAQALDFRGAHLRSIYFNLIDFIIHSSCDFFGVLGFWGGWVTQVDFAFLNKISALKQHQIKRKIVFTV